MGLWTEVGFTPLGPTGFGAGGFSEVVEDFLGVLPSLEHFRFRELEGGQGRRRVGVWGGGCSVVPKCNRAQVIL